MERKQGYRARAGWRGQLLKAEEAPASAARAHAYLWDFLSILSEIERNYLLDDDKDADSSGDVALASA